MIFSFFNLQYSAVTPNKSNHPLAVCVFFLLQVVLTVSQTVWARDATEALESEGDRHELLKEFELQNISVSNALPTMC